MPARMARSSGSSVRRLSMPGQTVLERAVFEALFEQERCGVPREEAIRVMRSLVERAVSYARGGPVTLWDGAEASM